MQKKSVANVAILTLVTFGIYSVFYLAKTNSFFKSLNYPTKPNWWIYFSLAVPVAAIAMMVAVIVPLYGIMDVQTEEQQAELSQFAAQWLVTAVIAMIITVTAGVLFLRAFWRYTHVAQNYTNGGVDPIIQFALLFFFPAAIPALLQYEYNKLGSQSTAPAPQAAPQAGHFQAAPQQAQPVQAPVQPQQNNPAPANNTQLPPTQQQ